MAVIQDKEMTVSQDKEKAVNQDKEMTVSQDKEKAVSRDKEMIADQDKVVDSLMGEDSQKTDHSQDKIEKAAVVQQV